jgi:hypothetical protein
MYAACVGISGYVPLPLTGNDYIELLPTVFRTVNDYGLTIDNRTYVGIIHGAAANPGAVHVGAGLATIHGTGIRSSLTTATVTTTAKPAAVTERPGPPRIA